MPGGTEPGRIAGQRSRSRSRLASVYVEILVAVAIFAAMMIPMLGGFRTGVRQTRLIRSWSSARYLSEWAQAQARAFVQAGTFEGVPCDDPLFAPTDLASDARTLFPGTVAPLFDLELLRTISCLDLGGQGAARPRIYQVEVIVRWHDPGQTKAKELVVRSIEGEEL